MEVNTKYVRRQFDSIEDRYAWVLTKMNAEDINRYSLAEVMQVSVETASNWMTKFRQVGFVQKKKNFRHDEAESRKERMDRQERVRLQKKKEAEDKENAKNAPKVVFGFPDKIEWTKTPVNEMAARVSSASSAVPMGESYKR